MSQGDIEDKKSNKVDPWPIIDTYFRDNPYYKSQHQIDSFNEFIYSEVNGIKYPHKSWFLVFHSTIAGHY